MRISDSVQRLCSRLLIGILLFSSATMRISFAHAAPSLVIGEVAWAGTSASLADEWVELWNLSDADISLAGYSLRGGSAAPIFFPEDAVIPARGTFLVSNYADTDAKSTLGISANVVTTTVSLSNTALHLSLYDATQEIDSVGDGGAPPAGSSGTPKASMIRTGSEWITATTTMNMDAGKTDLGTPGYCDGCSIQESAELPPEPPSTEPEPVTIPTEPDPTPSTEPNTPPSGETTSTAPEETPTTSPTADPPIETASSSEPMIVAEPAPPIIIEEPTVELTTSTVTETELTVTTVPEEPQPTNTVEPAQEETATSTTEEAVQTNTNTATTPVEVATPSVETANTVTSTPASETTTTAIATTPSYELLRLNEFMPQPEDGIEWIEITSIDTSKPTPLENVALYDAVGKIATIASGTIDGTTPFVRIHLSSAKLNNGGDTVTLRDPSGRIIDGVAYTFSEKAQSWSRIPNATGDWRVTATPTPNAANVFYEEKPAEEPIATAATSTTATMPTTSTTSAASTPVVAVAPTNAASTSSAVPSAASTPTQRPNAPILTAPQKATVQKPTSVAPDKKTPAKSTLSKPKQPKTTSTSTSAKKSSTTKKTASKPQPQSITHAMAHDESYGGVVVALQGIVGTPPSLLSGHYFVLLSNDGRGIKVHVPTSRKLPEAGTDVRVVGVLNFDDRGVPSLGMRKDDVLEVLSAKTTLVPKPRIVDLLAPSAEDAWSLLHVSGTVLSVKGTTVTLDLRDAEIAVSIKQLTGYRAARIQVGDTLRVQGVLDITDDTPRLVVRSADDVNITGHALSKPPTSTNTALPGWVPFGAAGIAVAGTEGAKKLRDRWKQRSLEKILQTGLNT